MAACLYRRNRVMNRVNHAPNRCCAVSRCGKRKRPSRVARVRKWLQVRKGARRQVQCAVVVVREAVEMWGRQVVRSLTEWGWFF